MPVYGTTDDIIHETICPTIDNTTYKNIYLIACPELYIWEAIYQLAKDYTYQIALLEILYHRFEHPAV